MASAPVPATTAPEEPAVDLARLTGVYIRIPDHKAERKRAMEAEIADLDAKLEVIEGEMLKHLNKHGMENVRTVAGTFYRQEDIKPNIVDDAAFYKWIKDNDAFDALERRVKKTFISEFMETHEGGLPPPGIHVHREYVVRVRKPQ